MNTLNLHTIGVISGCLALAGCSSSNQSGRASLASETQQTDFRAHDLGAMPGSAAINYHNSNAPAASAGRSYQARPRQSARVPLHRRSRTVSPPGLRRFAAMPRHKLHAPHVRQHESSCLRSGIVQPTRFIRPRSSIGGGQCYISKPFRMYAAARGGVRFEPAATLRCQMVPSVETWVQEVLRPAARRFLGSDIVQLRVVASYACRARNHKVGGKLSEHGKANAIDISKFKLADGRVVTVKRGWRGEENERRFLRYVHRGACEHFSTVLGPNADRHHHDHFHFDLARHGRRGTYRVCK